MFQNKRKFSAGSRERPTDLGASSGRSANIAVSYTYKSVDIEFIILDNVSADTGYRMLNVKLYCICTIVVILLIL